MKSITDINKLIINSKNATVLLTVAFYFKLKCIAASVVLAEAYIVE